MAEVASVRLRGWQAAVVGVAILAWAAWGFVRHIVPVPPEARDAVQAWLVEDYTQPDLHHRLLGFHPGQSGTAGAESFSLPSASGAPGDTAQVAIESLDGHGWKDFLITRVTLSAHRAGADVVHAGRYLAVSRLPNGKWTVMGESSAWNYWYALVPAPKNGSSWP